MCVTTTVYCQSLKNSEHLRDEWETIATSSPFTTLQSHKEQGSPSVSPDKAESSCITRCTATYDIETGNTPYSEGLGGEGGRDTYSHSQKQTSVIVTPQVVGVDPEMGGGDSGKFPTLDPNTIYILGAIGGALLVIMVTIILLGVVCLCRSRQRKAEVSGLKRSNTTRSSNTSDFVFNSAYEWTCRQTRLLDHLRPDTTGYQSHWSLTRDVSKKRTSLPRNISQKDVEPPSPETPGKSDTTQCAVANTEVSGANGWNSDSENACVVIEDEIQCVGSSDSLERVEHKSNEKDHNHNDGSIPHMKQTKRDSEAMSGETGTRSSYVNCNGRAVDMYSNPLYARRRERSRKKGGRELEEVDVEVEDEKEEEGKGERRRERWRESEKENDSIPQKKRSTASFVITPIEPLSSFLLSDSETYDSGNASAVSTDIASLQHSANHDAATSRVLADAQRQQQLLDTDEGGLVESSSFEFANNVAHKPIVK